MKLNVRRHKSKVKKERGGESDFRNDWKMKVIFIIQTREMVQEIKEKR